MKWSMIKIRGISCYLLDGVLIGFDCLQKYLNSSPYIRVIKNHLRKINFYCMVSAKIMKIAFSPPAIRWTMGDYLKSINDVSKTKNENPPMDNSHQPKYHLDIDAIWRTQASNFPGQKLLKIAKTLIHSLALFVISP